jgi:hypothetical protein
MFLPKIKEMSNVIIVEIWDILVENARLLGIEDQIKYNSKLEEIYV